MNLDLSKLLRKKAFIQNVSNKLNIEAETLRNYFQTNKVPEKYHNFIIKAYDFEINGDKSYIVMSFCNSKSLETILKEKQQITNNLVKYVFIQIIDAVSYIHDQLIIHRDIKPDNIFMDDCLRAGIH